MDSAGPHKWTFFRAGGVDQVVIKTGADIANLKDLDQKLWVALACPTRGINVDERTLDLIDSDDDFRIRPPEVLDAIDWCSKVFTDLDFILTEGDAIPLRSFSKETDEGKALKATAARILSDAGKKDSKEISLGDVQDVSKIFVATRFNGDGIIPVESADDEAIQQVIRDIIATIGSSTDRSGKPGINGKHAADFFAQAKQLVDWHNAGSEPNIRVIGDGTEAAAIAVNHIAEKVDDYFTRCRLAQFDNRGAAALNVSDASLNALTGLTLDPRHAEVRKLPLARPEGGRALPLDNGTNPAWTEEVSALERNAITPILGQTASLTESNWRLLRDKLAPFNAWAATKPTTSVEPIPIPRLQELLAGSARETIVALIDQDKALEGEYARIASVEKAVLYRKNFAQVLRNLVNFADFYGNRGATFQAGTLYLDARSCDLVVYVEDTAKHAKLAGLSSCYLAYCEISRPGEPKKQIVAAFTNGDTDNLMVGRNGVFYDRQGRDWDACVTTIIENPISVRQAFWTPYKRLVRLIEEQIAKRAAEKEKASSADIEKTAVSAANADQTKADKNAPPKKVDVGTVAAISVAITGFATFVSLTLATFLDLGAWLPLGLLAVVLAISGPSMLIAWLKLRRRNLGPILDANGWAIKCRARINVPFGAQLTDLPQLPKGASRALRDPFAEKPTPWTRYVVLAILIGAPLLWLLGKLDPYLPDSAKASTVLHRTPTDAPAPAPAPSK